MSKLSKVMLLSLGFLSFSAVLSTDAYSALKDEISDLESEISQARTKIGIEGVGQLKKLSKKFDRLSYEATEWDQLSLNNDKYHKWPNQTSKQAIGSSLFFPSKIQGFSFEELNEEAALSPSRWRNDILWSLAIAAKYNDPRGQYYLASLLESETLAYSVGYTQILDYYTALYSKAMPALESEAESLNPEALYILGREYATMNTGGGFVFDIKKSETYCTKLSALSPLPENASKEKQDRFAKQKGYSALRLVELKRRYSEFYKGVIVSPKDYEDIINNYSNFGPAIRYAGLVSKSKEVKKTFFLKASKPPYSDAFSYIPAGKCYQMEKENNKDIELYDAAINAGITEGYLHRAYKIVGNIAEQGKKFKSLMKQNTERADLIQYISPATEDFMKALNAGNLQAWDNLAHMYFELYNNYKEKEDLNQLRNVVERGLSLGHAKAYTWMHLFEKSQADELIEKYGKAPQKDLWESIKSFIEVE